MFSCRHAATLTLESFDRPLSPGERLDRFAHLLLCRHCRAHARQLELLKIVFNAAELPQPTLSRLARARILAKLQRLG